MKPEGFPCSTCDINIHMVTECVVTNPSILGVGTWAQDLYIRNDTGMLNITLFSNRPRTLLAPTNPYGLKRLATAIVAACEKRLVGFYDELDSDARERAVGDVISLIQSGAPVASSQTEAEVTD